MKLFQILLFAVSISSFSQKIKIEEGNINLLNKVNNYNVVFDYSDIQIVNYTSEQEFLKEKVALREKRKAGLGIKFKNDWFANRTNLYEPYFEKYFNDYFLMKRKIFVSQNNVEAKYTIFIKSIKLYPGYNVKMAWKSAKVWYEIKIYETKNPKNVILKFKPIKVYQGYYDMNIGKRVANAYGVLGKTMAKYLKRKT